MSKLAHSNQATMDEIERRSLEEQGEKVINCSRCDEMIVVGCEPDGCRDPLCPMIPNPCHCMYCGESVVFSGESISCGDPACPFGDSMK